MSIPVPEKPTVGQALDLLRERDEECAYLQDVLDGVTRAEEKQRQQRHHEVLCLVLKATIEGRMNIKAAGLSIVDVRPETLVDEARMIADLAYLPPKAEET